MFTIFINEEEVVCESNFQIKEEFMNASSVELYKVYPKSWKGTNKLLTDYYFPKDYSKCKIYKDGVIYFTGIVKNSADMQLNPFKPHYCSLQILSPTIFLSEGETLDYVIANKTITEAFKQLVETIKGYGFVVGNIQIKEDEVIGAYSTIDKSPYDVLNYLSEISCSRWGTRLIDENTTAIDLFSPDILNNLGNIECTQDYFRDNKIIDISYDNSTTDYRNKQVITSDDVYADIDYTETIIADGYTKEFNTQSKIGKLKNIFVDDVAKTFATEDDKELGIESDFYYKNNETGISSNENNPTISAGSEILIVYTPLVKGRQTIFNYDEINRINALTNTSGIIARYENRNDVLSSEELNRVAQTYIKFKGKAETTINIVSKKDFLKIGGKYQFTCPLNNINGEYLVKTKNTNIIQTGNLNEIRYEYELSNNFDTENEINYFDNQRAKAKGNIASGEFITRNIDIEQTANIIYSNLTINELAIEGNNILDCGLDAPFNN